MNKRDIAKVVSRLEDVLHYLERHGCNFWACKGPDYPRHMITCKNCWAIRDARVALRTARKLKGTQNDQQENRAGD